MSNEASQFLDANPDVEAIELLITDPGGVPRGKLIAREELLSFYNEGRCVAGSILGLDVTGEDVEATGLVWSAGDADRSVSLRVPAGAPSTRHIEHRMSGADANPYLVAAAVLAGVHAGVSGRLDPGPPTTGNGYESGISASLPRDWLGAIKAAEASMFLHEALGDEFLRAFVAIKTQEWDKYNALVPPTDHDWDLDSV